MSWNVTVRRASLVAAGAFSLSLGSASFATGDLLVAPTRVVLDGQRSAEVVLSNVDTVPATYRISVELRRMQPDGSLAEVDPAGVTPQERAMLEMAVVSPRRVRLEPNQPQTVRIGIRPPAGGVAPGEYRAHILFRAIPNEGGGSAATAAPANAPEPAASPTPQGVSISLRPIYGVTIPLFYRQGELTAQATMQDPRLEMAGTQPLLRFKLLRTGNRSTFGNIEVRRPGAATPLLAVRGIAVYTELGERDVTIPITSEQAAAVRGPVVVRYVAEPDAGGATLAEASATLR